MTTRLMTGEPLVHIVGGGRNQLAIVDAAKRLGCAVLVTDMYEDPPCRAKADLFAQVDTVDRAGTLEAAQRFDIDAVITDQTDVAVPTVALVAEELGLPGIGLETSLFFTNKKLMRDKLGGSSEFLLPQSHFFSDVRTAYEFLDSAPEGVVDWIVKPVNSQGSRGVARLTSGGWADQLAGAFAESREKGVLLEEFIAGEEYSVESFVLDGVTSNLAVTRKSHYASNECIDERNLYLDDVPKNVEEMLYRATSHIVDRLGPSFCSMHTEYMVKQGQVYLIETAARGGGGSISGKIVPFLTDFDPSRALVQASLSEDVDVTFGSYRDAYAVMRFFCFEPGVVKAIEYDQEATVSMLHFELDLTPGSPIRPIMDARDRPGYFVIGGQDRDSLLDQEERFLRSFKIEYE